MTETLTIPTPLLTGIGSACGTEDYHCGHLSRSSSRTVKRALFLYLAEVEGLGYLGGRSEGAEVLAVLNLMRTGAECADILDVAEGNLPAGVTTVEVAVTPITPDQAEVLNLVTLGYSYPEIAAETGRATETVRSLVKGAMRRTLTHTAIDAAVAAAGQGWI